jgi:hypothetical protein
MTKSWTIALAAAALLLPAALMSADDKPIPTDKQKKPPKKVITEYDLGGQPTRGTLSVGTPDTPAATEEKASDAKQGDAKPSPAPEPTESEKREARQKEIQAEIDYQAANIRTLQEQADTAQAQLNDLTDLTFSAEGTGTGRRAALMKLIDDANAQIRAARDTIATLEEQARQAGVRVNVP